MELSDASFGGTKVLWISMEYSMEFHGTRWYFIWRHQSSMEFHGIFHGIPWNTCVIWNGGLPITWNPVDLDDFFLFGDSRVPCYSMEYSTQVKGNMVFIKMRISNLMDFHGTLVPPNEISISSMEYSMEYSMELWCHQMTYDLVPWNSMEHSMEFHGTLVAPKEVSLSSMEFHGTLRLSFYDLLPWTSKAYSMEVHGTKWYFIWRHQSSMEFHGIFHGIPWNNCVKIVHL